MFRATFATIVALMALAVSGCGSDSPDNSTAKADYSGLLQDLKTQYPHGGWTLDLAKKSANNVCDDLGSHSYEDVVLNRSTLLGGDRAQATELVIASVKYACPGMTSKVPGM